MQSPKASGTSGSLHVRCTGPARPAPPMPAPERTPPAVCAPRPALSLCVLGVWWPHLGGSLEACSKAEPPPRETQRDEGAEALWAPRWGPFWGEHLPEPTLHEPRPGGAVSAAALACDGQSAQRREGTRGGNSRSVPCGQADRHCMLPGGDSGAVSPGVKHPASSEAAPSPAKSGEGWAVLLLSPGS